jgi:ketosteroid isomerase-like protein
MQTARSRTNAVAARSGSEIDLVRRCFQALIQGDYAVLEASLAEDAKWRTVEEGASNCEGRATIIGIMRRNLGGRLKGEIEGAVQDGTRVIVGFRPERPSDAEGRPLEAGLAYMVVTIQDGQITELKGCADRAGATAYARTPQA